MNALDRQTRLLCAFGLFNYPFACVPFLYFYFADQGIDLSAYMWLIAAYYWAMVLMEIPTGLLADRFGRKSAMVGGSLLLTAGFVWIWAGQGFAAYCGAEILLGCGHALLSGAPTAMLFDSLGDDGQEARFLRLESRVHALRLIGTGASFLIGGLVAAWCGLRATILLTAALTLCGSMLALMLREQKRHRHQQPLLRAALQDLRHPILIWLVVYFVLLFGLLRFAFHAYQPYFNETVFDRAQPQWITLGFLFAALNFLAAPCSRLAPRLAQRYRYRSILPWLPISLSLSFLLMAWLPNWLGVLLFFVHQVPFGLHWGLIQDFINQRVRAISRATALSIVSFAGRLSFALLAPAIGSFQNAEGTPNTYLLVGGTGLIAAVVWCSPPVRRRLWDA